MEPEVTTANLDKVLTFLPLFEGPTDNLYSVQTDYFTFYPYEYSPDVLRFIQTLYNENIIFVFDWSSWKEEAARYMEDQELVAQADLSVLRRLLTLHIRADRFNDGHIAMMIDSGHILAILRRLNAIRDEM